MSAQFEQATPELSQGFHVYSVEWTASRVTWCFDNRPIASAPTPADMHGPMYVLINLAVGGDWAGAPAAAATFPAEMTVDWIRIRRAPSVDVFSE